MKKIFILCFLSLFLYAKDSNSSKKTFGIPYPMEREIEAFKVIKNTIVDYDDTINSVKKAYSKSLKNDFKDMEEFEKSISNK